ncbi:hypothetical protein L596_020261 [Steinernema carpocapsae]|uniref:G-protein coupled receptors family 1 profile domain-containing protein n=1 Tax=Steinernema carpocapsae TaxID=34508 RepID=A0A4V6A0Y2_STECR|nr:hypothetical protein L596_020261 [Steinernema carpocapsae]
MADRDETLLIFCQNGTLIGNPDDSQRGLITGIIYLCVACISIPMSCLILYAFTRPEQIKHSSTKCLTIATSADILNMINACVISGLASIYGWTLCDAEKYWFFVFNYWVLWMWYFYCIASMVLAVNRMLNFVSTRAYNLLFSGRKPWLWLVFMMCYCTAGMIITPCVLVYFPNLGHYKDAIVNPFHIYQNFAKIGIVTSSYTIMLIYIARMQRSLELDHNYQIPVSLQSMGVAMLGDFCAIAFLLGSYVPQHWAFYAYSGTMSHSSWLALHSELFELV